MTSIINHKQIINAKNRIAAGLKAFTKKASTPSLTLAFA